MNVPIESGLEVVEPKIEPYSQGTGLSTGYSQPEVAAIRKTTWLQRNSRVLLFLFIAAVIVAAIIGGAVGGVLHNRHRAVSSPIRPTGSNGTLSPNSLPVPNPQRASSCRGGICPFTIADITLSDTRFIFGLSANRSLVYKTSSNNQWNATWTDLGGGFTYTPVILSPNPESLAAIGIQEDQVLYWRGYKNGTWDPTWTKIGGTWATGISAVSRSAGFVNVYGLVSDGGNLQQSAWTPADDGSPKWVGIFNLAGNGFGVPSVAAWSGSREDIFVRGTDNSLQHLYWNQNTGWAPWESLGGIITSPPLTVSSQEYWLDVFALGLGNSFCWRGYHQSWIDWECITGNLTFESIPSAVVMGPDRVDAVGLASDDHVYHKSLVDSSWSTNWDDLGGPLNGAPVAASFMTNMGSVLGIGMDNSLYIGNWNSSTFSWQGSTDWSSLGGDFITLL